MYQSLVHETWLGCPHCGQRWRECDQAGDQLPLASKCCGAALYRDTGPAAPEPTQADIWRWFIMVAVAGTVLGVLVSYGLLTPSWLRC